METLGGKEENNSLAKGAVFVNICCVGGSLVILSESDPKPFSSTKQCPR